ncbi:Arc family DNA-binding protein [Pseudomonas sp. MWU12-2323]|uniref:Arc family DNA-binding protein n=1 Tax=Pseudomonas sp. MWU12-2323 TaxID=2651296 RepID=UPI00128D3588|nr:Arc family DNA-binding protein [Pseudomonas sp. MWU12-2323]MPQ71492.1 Arc family DNA-binding protein [Pseudomonas sp. MWU12-2323]
MIREPISRNADKFNTRMPDDMRPRLDAYAKKNNISMNTALIQGLDSFLDNHDDLSSLLQGVRLLKAALETERAELATLKEQLAAQLAKLDGTTPPAKTGD